MALIGQNSINIIRKKILFNYLIYDYLFNNSISNYFILNFQATNTKLLEPIAFQNCILIAGFDPIKE